MHDHSEANAKWKDQLEDFRQSNAYKLFGIDGEPIRVENFPRTQKGDSSKDPRRSGRATDPEHLEGRLVFMSMFNVIGQRREILQNVFFEFREGQTVRKKVFHADTGHSSAKDKKTHGMKRTLTNLTDSGI